jgi:hypothetical protein
MNGKTTAAADPERPNRATQTLTVTSARRRSSTRRSIRSWRRSRRWRAAADPTT